MGAANAVHTAAFAHHDTMRSGFLANVYGFSLRCFPTGVEHGIGSHAGCRGAAAAVGGGAAGVQAGGGDAHVRAARRLRHVWAPAPSFRYMCMLHSLFVRVRFIENNLRTWQGTGREAPCSTMRCAVAAGGRRRPEACMQVLVINRHCAAPHTPNRSPGRPCVCLLLCSGFCGGCWGA